MTKPLPEGPHVSRSGRVLRRVLRVLNRPSVRLVLTILALLALALLFGS